MSLAFTIAALALCGGLFAYGSWRASKPADPLKPRLAPWRTIIVVAGAAGVFMLVHLAHLLGFEAGQR
ncbi:MAG: hypothetical protein AB7M12_09200 [Hyphomonadaceae bacterium]